MNPITELVVAPKIVFTSPRVGSRMAIPKANNTIPKVHKKFYFLVNFALFFKRSSSKESLAGRTQNGEAKRTTQRIKMTHTLIIVMSP